MFFRKERDLHSESVSETQRQARSEGMEFSRKGFFFNQRRVAEGQENLTLGYGLPTKAREERERLGNVVVLHFRLDRHVRRKSDGRFDGSDMNIEVA